MQCVSFARIERMIQKVGEKMESNVILKTKDERQFSFFYDKGLCFRETGRFGASSKMIYEDCSGQFDALELDCGKLVILCEDRQGGIVFLSEDGEEWLKTTLLKSKSGQTSEKNFFLFEQNGWLNGFYCLRYQGQILLVHHIIDNEDLQPQVVDLLREENVCVFSLENGDFLAVYASDYANGNLGFKRYAWNRKEWGRFEIIDKGELLFACRDEKENLYVAYCQEDACWLKVLKKDDYQTVYSQQQFPLPFLNGVRKNVRLVIENGKLWILYPNGASIFAAYCTLDSYAFSTPQQFVSRGEGKPFSLKAGGGVWHSYGYWNGSAPELFLLKNKGGRVAPDNSAEIERFAGISKETEQWGKEQIEDRKKELELSILRRDIETLKKRLTSLEKSVVYKER